MDKAFDGSSPDITRVREAAGKFIDNVGKVIVGKKDAIDLVLVAMLCEGHVLVEDVPGTGKTMLAKATARSIGGSFKRIQCTPDLLPSDVTGIHFFNQRKGEFELRPGPIVANIVLADEVNRATPRTQACLLECMQEQQVTVDLETVPLPRPFIIMATQNPVELEGTFPLPEAQLDRFLLRIKLGYPSASEESTILTRYKLVSPLESLESVMKATELLALQALCRQVYIEETVRNYIVAVTRATRGHQNVELGASPRASLALSAAARAQAAIAGRNFVIPDDVKRLAIPALAHRLILKTEARLRGKTVESTIEEIISTVAVPAEDRK